MNISPTIQRFFRCWHIGWTNQHLHQMREHQNKSAPEEFEVADAFDQGSKTRAVNSDFFRIGTAKGFTLWILQIIRRNIRGYDLRGFIRRCRPHVPELARSCPSMAFFNLLNMTIDGTGINQISPLETGRGRLGTTDFPVLTISPHTARISRMAQLRIADSGLFDGQRELFIRSDVLKCCWIRFPVEAVEMFHCSSIPRQTRPIVTYPHRAPTPSTAQITRYLRGTRLT